jgi:flavin-dependent dehydrogenase
MIYSKVIIVGGGPAGSTCGWKLKQNGIECLILDKQEFPRTKLCAGWITPQIIKDLMIDINDYPHSLVEFNKFHVHFYSKELKIHQRSRHSKMQSSRRCLIYGGLSLFSVVPPGINHLFVRIVPILNCKLHYATSRK